MHLVGRRALLIAGAASPVVPRAARPQPQDRVHRIGFLSPTAPGARNEAFLQGLRELGYVQGKTVLVEMRFADGRPERLPGLVDELIRSKVDRASRAIG